MILEHVKNLKVENIGEAEDGLTAGIAEESMPFVFEFMSTQLYSNPIGSMIREITSNCFDSHIEANVDKPVKVRRVWSEEEGYAIEFEDSGMGMSPKRVMKIFMNYFSSTKRVDNSQIGGFGIGSKTPLAYAEFFYITTWYNGMEYEYIYHKGETKPMLDSLKGWGHFEEDYESYEIVGQDELGEPIYAEEPTIKTKKWKEPIGEETTHENGTIIRVNIQQQDMTKFVMELKQQLTYFDNVYFQDWGISNNYEIYEGRYFKFRPDVDSSTLHICLGSVRYPIDNSILKLPDSIYNIPVAIKFDVGELKVTPSREDIRYLKDDIPKIKERAELVRDELLAMFDKQNPIESNFMTYIANRNYKLRITFNADKAHYLMMWGKDRDRSLKYAPLADYKFKFPKYDDNIFFHWQVVGEFRRGGIRDMRVSSTFYLSDFINKKYIIVEDKDNFSTYTDINISRRYYGDILLIKRKKLRDLGTDKIYDYLGLKGKRSLSDKGESNVDVNKAKTVSAYLREMDKQVRMKAIGTYGSFKPSDEWIADYKKEVLESSAAYQRKINKEVFVRDIAYGGSGKNVKLASIVNHKGIIVYGFKDDRGLLSRIYSVLYQYMYHRKDKNSEYKVYQVAQNALNSILLDAPNLYYCEDFIKHEFMITAKARYEYVTGVKAIGDKSFFNLYSKFIYGFRERYDKLLARSNSFGKKHYKYGVNCRNLLQYTGNELFNKIPSTKDNLKEIEDFKRDFFTGHVPLLTNCTISQYISEENEDYGLIIALLKSAGVRLKNHFYLKTKKQLDEERYKKRKATSTTLKKKIGQIKETSHRRIIGYVN